MEQIDVLIINDDYDDDYEDDDNNVKHVYLSMLKIQGPLLSLLLLLISL